MSLEEGSNTKEDIYITSGVLIQERSNRKKEADITSGVLIDTQYPLEKFLIKWRISNYSMIFNDIETNVFTSSKSTAWRLRLRHSKIRLWRYDDKHGLVCVQYKAVMKTCRGILENEGSCEFNHMRSNECVLLTIPSHCTEINNTLFENDVLNFQCTMTILGHTITRQINLANGQQFKSEQVNYDLENIYGSKAHSDIIISDGKNEIPAHKTILCARSPVFNVMFQQNMFENENNEVKIDDIDFYILQNFLYFLYTGKVKELSWNSTMELYYAADKYEVLDLRDVCSEFLQTNLTVENACDILKLADQHKNDELKEGAVFFIRMHASSVKLTTGWENLIRTHPKIIAECFI